MVVRKEIVLVIILTFCIFAVLAGMAIYEWNRDPRVHLAPRAEPLLMTSTKSPGAKTSRKLTTGIYLINSTTFSETSEITGSSGRFCETPECMHLAHQLHNWKDPTIDPCTDFYQYACGRYIEHSDSDGNRNEEKRNTMMNLLEHFLVGKESLMSKSENVMRDVYRKCEELKGKKNFKNEIRDVYKDILSIGAWPMVESMPWSDSMFNSNDRLSNLAKLSMLNFGLFEYELLPNKNLILKRSKHVFRKSTELEKMSDWMKKVVKEICKVNKLNCDNHQIQKDFKKVWNFKKEIEAIPPPAKPSNLTYMHWENVKAKFKIFNFPKIIEPLTQHGDLEKVIGNILIRPENMEVFKKMEEIVQKTAPRILANFLALKYLEMSSKFLTFDHEYSRRSCVKVVNELLPNAVLRVFVRNHFDKQSMKDVAEMINQTQKSYIEMFKSSKFLSESSRKTMISKIQKMKILVGYPKEFEVNRALDKTFERLKLKETDTYYSTVKKVNVLSSEWLMEFVAGNYPMNPTMALNSPNAYYVDGVNQLAILTAYMDTPKFHWTYPTYARFATVGRVIGHELGHAFDKRGITFDDNGTRSDWMDLKEYKAYRKRIKCLEKQYDEYDDPVYGRNLNGKKVIMEIIADRLGQEIAYKTFKKSLLQEEKHIIGTNNQSFDQLFFNMIALDYCTPRSKETLKKVLEGSHPQNIYRVNGIMKNLKQFAEAYNCPVGAQMNPEEKCELF